MSVVPLICTEPDKLIAQALLPGTDAVAVPVQAIDAPESVAVAVPLPDTGTVPLQVAENVPVTLLAVAPVTDQVNPPQVLACDDTDLVDENVPALNPAVTSDAVALVVGAVDAPGIVPHAVATTIPPSTATCLRSMTRDDSTAAAPLNLGWSTRREAP